MIENSKWGEQNGSIKAEGPTRQLTRAEASEPRIVRRVILEEYVQDAYCSYKVPERMSQVGGALIAT